MIKTPYYSSQITINDAGKKSIKNEFSYWDGFTKDLINAEITQDLISEKSIMVKDCSIFVTLKSNKGTPRLKQLLDIANQVLHDDFKMDCDDEFGLHRTVVAGTIQIYQCGDFFSSDYSINVKFDLIIKLAKFNEKRFIAMIRRKGFVNLYPFPTFIKALKLEKDRPCDFIISEIQGKFWIHQSSNEIKDLWQYYASQILDTIDHSDHILRLAQISCPDKELRDRLQKINPLDYRFLRNYQEDLEMNSVKLKALQKILNFQDDEGNLKEKVGLYIVQQIRENPEKYLNSEFPFIKEIAAEIHSLS